MSVRIWGFHFIVYILIYASSCLFHLLQVLTEILGKQMPCVISTWKQESIQELFYRQIVTFSQPRTCSSNISCFFANFYQMRLNIYIKLLTNLYHCKSYHQFSKGCNFTSVAFELSKHEFLWGKVEDCPWPWCYKWRSFIHEHFSKNNFLFVFLQFFYFILNNIRTFICDSFRPLVFKLLWRNLRNYNHRFIFRETSWVHESLTSYVWISFSQYLNCLLISLNLDTCILTLIDKIWQIVRLTQRSSTFSNQLQRTSDLSCESSFPSIWGYNSRCDFMKWTIIRSFKSIHHFLAFNLKHISLSRNAWCFKSNIHWFLWAH